MRRRSPLFVSLSLSCVVSLCASDAFAAQPASPAVSPAPAPATTTTEVSSPAGAAGGPSVVVVNTTVGGPAATPAPAPVAAPAPAPAPHPTWIVPVQPAPAPAVTVPSRVAVDLYPHPLPAPSAAEQARMRKVGEVSRARGLAVGGWATLGSSYAFSALIGTIVIDTARDRDFRPYGYWMTIPVVGPFAAAFKSRTATGALLTASLGVTQLAGLGMALVGTARHRRLKRELSFAAMPTRGGGQVAMAMRF